MKTDKQSYYAEASTWARNDADGARRARNLAWIVSAAAVLVALAEAIALACLAPLKSTSVVPILVDRETGFVQVLDKDGSLSLRTDTALIHSMLAQYVQAREGFNITTLGADYRRVMLWSTDRARSSYATLMPAQNPQSPLHVYPRSALLQVEIESISELSPRTALVRFTTVRTDEGASAGGVNAYAAVVTYRFSDTPLHAEDRLTNPLGFQVASYERSDEVPAAPRLPQNAPPAALPPVEGFAEPRGRAATATRPDGHAASSVAPAPAISNPDPSPTLIMGEP
jgi:type IV secretion system protein VirB8